MFNPFEGLKQATVSLIAAIAILAALAFGLGLAVQTARINGFLWMDGLETQLSNANAQIATMKEASRKAEAEQIAINQAPAANAAAIAGKSEHEAPAYYAAARSTADAHAVRVRDPSGVGTSAPADLPRTDRAVEGVHGPAGPAGLVCRPEVDDRQLVTAAARAAQMHQEAIDLISAGAARAASPSVPAN